MSHHKDAHDDTLIHESPDIRRRMRLRAGIAKYTFTNLFEALRSRRKYVRNATIALLGFPNADDQSGSAQTAQEIRSILEEQGAHIRELDASSSSGTELKNSLKGTDAVIIATDHRVFRALRPREFREIGIDVVIPTTLRE